MAPCLSMGVSTCNPISKLDNNYATLHSQCGYGNCRWICSINGDVSITSHFLSLIHRHTHAHTHTKHWSNHHKLSSSLLLFNPSHHYPPSDIHSPLFNLTGRVSADWARIIPMWFMSFFFFCFFFTCVVTAEAQLLVSSHHWFLKVSFLLTGKGPCWVVRLIAQGVSWVSGEPVLTHS